MADFPALMLWTDKYLADTRHLTTLEHGAYLLLIMEAWRRPHCDLPDDDALLARMAGLSAKQWADVRPVIMAFWNLDKRRKSWRQKKLTSERDYVQKKRRSQQDKASKRWKDAKNGDATAQPRQSRGNAPTPTPTPTLIEEEESKDSFVASAATNGNGTANLFGPADPETEPPPPPEFKPEHVVEAWNSLATECGLPRIAKLSDQRRRQLKARMREHSLDDFVTAIDAIRRSPFLREGNGTWRGANFDFFLQPSSFLKLIEGHYEQPAN
jgi:uncharacterized protein YdaU (DUF1376 family)